MPEPLTIASDGLPVYPVKRLHESKFVDRRKHVLVEWEGFPERSDYTWEPRTRLLEDIPELVKAYERVERARRRDAGRLS